jgi:hypothetical protein
MKFDDYLGSLLPSFTRQRILEDIEAAREELADNTLEPLKAIARSYGSYKWKSDWVEEFDGAFKHNVKGKYNGNILNGMLHVMETVEENLDLIESLVEREYKDELFRDAMSILRINILQYVEAMSFAIEYTRRLLVAIMACEVATVNGDTAGETLPTKGEFDWIAMRRESYFTVMNILAVKKEEVEKRFAELPEVIITKDTFEQTRATVGYAKVDPMSFGLIPLVLNPIYHVRMAVADWQVSRFKAAEEERRMLEFRLMQLKLAVSDKKDAKLEQQIEYTQNRLSKLRYELKEMGEKYGTAH